MKTDEQSPLVADRPTIGHTTLRFDLMGPQTRRGQAYVMVCNIAEAVAAHRRVCDDPACGVSLALLAQTARWIAAHADLYDRADAEAIAARLVAEAM